MGYVPPCFWFDDNLSFGVTNYTSNATGASITDLFTTMYNDEITSGDLFTLNCIFLVIYSLVIIYFIWIFKTG